MHDLATIRRLNRDAMRHENRTQIAAGKEHVALKAFVGAIARMVLPGEAERTDHFHDVHALYGLIEEARKLNV